MLTFFRKIRKSLIASSSVRKYLLYAIGEIALVVIGILIALQINNWNEWRKERLVEKEILHDLSVNIERNIDILKDGLQILQNQNDASNIIINALENKLAYTDSLDKYFWKATLRGTMQGILTHNGFEAYKNVGFDVVLTDTLKNAIINLFEVNYKREAEIISLYRNHNDNYDQIWSEYFNVSRFDTYLQTPENPTAALVNTPVSRDRELLLLFKPKKYKALKQNTEVLFALHDINFGRNWLYQSQVDCLSESQRILQLIKEELGEE